MNFNDIIGLTPERVSTELSEYEKTPGFSLDNVLSKFKIGKKDPFSKGETKFNQFSTNFKLTGFLNTKKDNYVFVSYQGNKGTISENSIGGSNTNLLPNGAKVIEIDSKKSQLKINFDNEVYIFEF